MKMTLAYALALSAALVLCSCDGNGNTFLPKSGGLPYEVLVLASCDSECVAAVNGALSKDMPGLPQKEPMFDVSSTDSSHFTQLAKLARNIVVVNVNPRLFTSTRIRYEKDVWAKPQIVIYVNAASDSSLMSNMPQVGRRLSNLLTSFELNTAVSQLRKNSGANVSKPVQEMFGYSIMLPLDMKTNIKGRDFVWFSNNSTHGMKNVCVYSYSGTSLIPGKALDARDSVMAANIRGESDSMRMRTVRGSVSAGTANVKGHIIMVTRGLWEVCGDAMGGPFVSHSIVDTANRRIIVAEAFVYAPGMKKRNLLRQVEAALYTLKKDKKTKGNGKTAYKQKPHQPTV